jgi:CzcA family heavy metal efflux pump
VLRPVVRWSLHRPHLVAWAWLWVLVLGGVYLTTAQIDVLPNLAPVQATVETEAPGLVAEQVEETVTQPIESALLGTAGVAGVESRSIQGLSIVTVRFSSDADPYRVRQSVTENLGRLGALPPGVSSPRLSPLTAPGPAVMTIGFTSAKLDPMALRDLVQWVVRPRLLSTAGVANVAVYGGQVRRIEVRARPGDLSDSDLGFLDILQAVRRSTSVTGAGFIDTPNQRVLIEPHGQAETIEQVGAGQIQTAGSAPVRIDDVADVVEAPTPANGDALIMGKPGVLVVIDRVLGANTLATTEAIDRSLSVVRPALAAQGVEVRTDLDRPANFVTSSTRGIVLDLIVGLTLVAIALLIFVRDVRVVLVCLVAVPLTLIVSLMVLKAFGWTLNAMTLGGLAVALGLVIDDAVIDVESIITRLRDVEGRHATRSQAILAGSLEVRGPVLYATVALALSLVPMLMLSGPERLLLAPLAAMIIVGALVSVLVAMVVTPAFALLFLRHIRAASEPAPLRRLKARHGQWLTVLNARRWPAMGAAGAVVVLAIIALLVFRSELLPSVHDSNLVIETDAPTSTSPDAVRGVGMAVAKDILALPGVRTVSQQIGRDGTSDNGAGIEHSTFDVGLDPGLSDGAQQALVRRIRTATSVFPGPPALIRWRFDAGQGGGESPTSLQVSVFGQDLDAVDPTAARVSAILSAMPNKALVHSQISARSPVVRVDLNFNRLALFGLSAADVLDTVQAAFAGETVAKIYEGPRVLDLAITAQASLRQDPEAVGDLLLRSTSGISVPLKSIANVYLTDGRAEIAHEGGLRRAVVDAAPGAGDIDRFATAARAEIARKLTLPPGVFLDFSVSNSSAQTNRNLAAAYGLGLFVIFAFLSIIFDGRTAGLILASILFALIGGVVAITLSGGVLSIGAIAGLVALVGLSMRSAILLVSRAEDMTSRRRAAWTLETVIGAAGERFVALLASAAVVALALAPFAFNAGAAGLEVLGPMSIVIILGLLTSAVGNLTLLPIMMLTFWRPRLPRETATSQS